MTVRAKFFVKELKHVHVDGPDVYAEVIMSPVFGSYPGASGKDDDNKQWSKWTPSGELKMAVTNPAAISQFDVGKAYYLDFTPVK